MHVPCYAPESQITELKIPLVSRPYCLSKGHSVGGRWLRGCGPAAAAAPPLSGPLGEINRQEKRKAESLCLAKIRSRTSAEEEVQIFRSVSLRALLSAYRPT